jgi:hypothetical protein
MSKDFTEVKLDLFQLGQELERFRLLLSSKEDLGERELQNFLKASPNLTAGIGSTFGRMGVADRLAFEFEILGDYSADIVIGNQVNQFCLIELESAERASILERVGKKATKDWSRRFEHGFSQIVDWFCHLDDFKGTERFRRNFGYGPIDFTGVLLIGRNAGLDADDARRLRWRTHHVVVNSHPVICKTYDDLYTELKAVLDRYSTAFRTASPSTQAAPPTEPNES